jgi:hypothetical protein
MSLSKVVSIDSIGGGCEIGALNTPCAYRRRNRLQGSHKVRQKSRGVVIPFVQRQPSRRSLTAGDPFADQRRFAKPGRCRDESQLCGVDPRSSARSGAGGRPLWARGGYKEFRGENWQRHTSSIRGRASESLQQLFRLRTSSCTLEPRVFRVPVASIMRTEAA